MERSSRTDAARSASDSEAARGAGDEQLSQQEMEQLRKLNRRDQEVRTHEQAHLSAAGQYARGGMSFTYQRGPDGVSYAVGGEVGIDLSEEATPEATLLKMQTVQRAALAPANPSGADRQIAAQAAAKAAQARQEVLQETREELADESASPAEADVQPAAPSSSAPEVPETPSPSSASLKSAIAAYNRTAAF